MSVTTGEGLPGGVRGGGRQGGVGMGAWAGEIIHAKLRRIIRTRRENPYRFALSEGWGRLNESRSSRE